MKISENHEKFVEKVEFYSSISLSRSGSGFRIRIRIQHGILNPDPTGSGSETLLRQRKIWPHLLNLSELRDFLRKTEQLSDDLDMP